MTDELLVLSARAGDKDALSVLLCRYAELTNLRAAAFACSFCEREDLAQEGLLGVLAAVRGYDESRGVSFRTYAGDCIDNRMLSLVRASSRRNRRQGETVSLTEAEPLFSPSDPEAVVLGREEYASVMQKVTECLSDYEKKVLALYVEGLSYTQMGALLHKEPKSVGNALTRIRKKLRHETK